MAVFEVDAGAASDWPSATLLDARRRRGCSRSNWQPVDADSALLARSRSDEASRSTKRCAISAGVQVSLGIDGVRAGIAHRSLAVCLRAQCVARARNSSSHRRVKSLGLVVVGGCADAPLPAAGAGEGGGCPRRRDGKAPANFMQSRCCGWSGPAPTPRHGAVASSPEFAVYFSTFHFKRLLLQTYILLISISSSTSCLAHIYTIALTSSTDLPLLHLR